VHTTSGLAVEFVSFVSGFGDFVLGHFLRISQNPLFVASAQKVKTKVFFVIYHGISCVYY
jgi:hypothetical protein